MKWSMLQEPVKTFIKKIFSKITIFDFGKGLR